MVVMYGELGWHKKAIPRAENLYRQHIEKLGEING